MGQTTKDLPCAQRFRQLFSGVCSGLRFLHQQGMLHGELARARPRHCSPPPRRRALRSTPDNVLLDNQWNAKLMDFGLQATKAYVRGTERPFNLLPYTPYECSTGPCVPASDVYALGVMDKGLFPAMKEMEIQAAFIHHPVGLNFKAWPIQARVSFRSGPGWI